MLKLFCSLLFIIGFVANSLGQTSLVIDDTLHLNRGIYKNFKEFRKNSPSIFVEFTIDTIYKSHGLVGQKSHESYKMILKDPKLISKDQKIWGFCDGKHVYINSNDVYRKGNIYNKLEFLGRYCLFSTLETAYFPVGGMVGVGIGGTRYLTEYLIDINMGLSVAMTTDLLRQILQKDPELLAEFENEEKKGRKLSEYIKKYSLKHPEEVKR